MAITVTAAWDDARLIDGNNAEIELMFFITDDDGNLLPEDALVALQTDLVVPTTFGGLLRDSV